MTAASEEQLSLHEVGAEMWAVYRRHWRFLVPAAMVVLLPQSIADAFLEGSHVEHLRTIGDFATVGGALLTAAVNILGQAIYAGLTAAAVIDWRAGQPLPPLGSLLRALPIKNLIALDLVITMLTAIGFVALVFPALIVLTYLAISPAVMKIEHLGVQQALARSIELVRGRAGQVFLIAVGAIVFSEAAVQLLAAPFHSVGVLTVANLLAEGIFQPIEGLAVVLVAIHLLELHGQSPGREQMARALVSEPD